MNLQDSSLLTVEFIQDRVDLKARINASGEKVVPYDESAQNITTIDIVLAQAEDCWNDRISL